MTIALGSCGNKGVVLAADSQETVSGYIKNRRGKIHTVIFPYKSVLSFVGSGTSDYIETAFEKAIAGIGDKDNLPEIVRVLEENLLSFFDTHIARWAYFPENERPTVELLIGITTKRGPFGLYHYNGTAFHRVSQKAIGVGILLANNMAQFEGAITNATVESMGMLAVYILAQVKKQVDSCGGFTDVVALKKNGDFAMTDTPQIELLETEIEAIEKASIEALTQKLTAKSVRLTWMGDALRKARQSRAQI